MKKILKRTLATILTMVILFGAVPLGAFNLSTKADAVNISSTYLNTSEQLFKDFIKNKDYLDFELAAFAIWYDQDLTNLEHYFFVFDFDLDGNNELIMQTLVYNHQDFAVFKVEHNEVIMIDDTALYKGGYDYLIRNSRYNGLVCQCGVGMYCDYYDINGSQGFGRTYYNGKISYENYNMDNDLYEILSDEYLDSNGHFVNDNLTPIFWYSVDEIEALGWNEFFNPSWNAAYLDFVKNNKYYQSKVGVEGVCDGFGSETDLYLYLYDMDLDGVPELIISNGLIGQITRYCYIFAYQNGEVRFTGITPYHSLYKVSDSRYPGFFTWSWFGIMYYFQKEGDTISRILVADELKNQNPNIYNIDLYNAYISNNEFVEGIKINDLRNQNYAFNYYKWKEITEPFITNPRDVPDFTQNFWIGGVPGSVTLNFKNSWFDNDSINYNHELCQFASKFAMLGYDQGDGKGNHTENFNELKSGLKQCGFSNIDINKDPGRDRVDYCLASRIIKKNGEDYTLIFANFIGTNGDQWDTDFTPGYKSKNEEIIVHEGFEKAKNFAKGELTKYISERNIAKDKTVLLLTGHSRGAATANLLAADLIDSQEYALMNNIFTYSFATPNTTLDLDHNGKDLYNEKYLRIFSIVNPEDLVTKFLPSAHYWGFGRYGRTFTLPSHTNTKNWQPLYDNMNVLFKKYNDNVEYAVLRQGEATSWAILKKMTDTIHSTWEYSNTKYNYNGKYITMQEFLLQTACNFFKGNKAKAAAFLIGKNIEETSKMDVIEVYNSIIEFGINLDGYYKELILELIKVLSGEISNNMFDRLYHMHDPKTYCAWVCSMGSELETKEFGSYMGIVNCPVDVEIYDKSTNEIVGRIKNNVVDETIAAKDNSIVMTVDGDSKRFWLPSDGEYDVKLVGNDTGTMDYTVATVDSDKGETERVNFFDVAITDKLTLTSQMSGEDFELDSYSLKYSNGKTLKPTEYTKDISNVNITVKTDGNGLATGSMSVKSGDYVILTATPNKNYEFIGWHKGGKLVSTDMTYSLVAKEDSTFTAKFTEYALGDVNADDNINSADALLVLQHSVGQINLTCDNFTRANVTKDKMVNSADALKILQYSVGQIEQF